MSFDPSLYDFETVFEDVWAKIMDLAGLKAATPRTGNVFAKERPRVEGMFEAGVAKQSYHIVAGQLRNASWQGQFEVVIITQTQTDDQSSTAHRVFRADVRSLMGNLKQTINGDDASGNHYLPFHQIQNIVETGITPIYKHTEGSEMSLITYRVDFGVRASAWADTGPGTFAGSGAVDPFFGSSGYQLNNPTRGQSGPTLLTWTVPDLTQEVAFSITVIGPIFPDTYTIWNNSVNDLSTAKAIVYSINQGVFFFPKGLFYWGVTGLASAYTQNDLNTLTAFQDDGAHAQVVAILNGNPLGSGYALSFQNA